MKAWSICRERLKVGNQVPIFEFKVQAHSFMDTASIIHELNVSRLIIGEGLMAFFPNPQLEN